MKNLNVYLSGLLITLIVAIIFLHGRILTSYNVDTVAYAPQERSLSRIADSLESIDIWVHEPDQNEGNE